MRLLQPMLALVAAALTASCVGAQAVPTRVDLTVQRFDDDSGRVLVSNAIPLAPGMVTAADLPRVHLTVAGVEQSIYLEPLAGHYPDGSLRSVLVQFHHVLGPVRQLAAELVIGGGRRGAADLPRPSEPRGMPRAVALPAQPAYLVSTGLVGPTLTADSTAALGFPFNRYDDEFAKWAEYHWKLSADTWNDGNYYDRALVYYAAWARTGRAEYWRRGTMMALSYRRGYLGASGYEAPPHWSFVEGVADHYWLTGDDSSRMAVKRLAEYQWRAYGRGMTPAGVWDTEARIAARILQAYLFAWKLDAPGEGVPGQAIGAWRDLLPSGLGMLLKHQDADGSFRAESYCRQNANFASGILNDVLMEYYTDFARDPRIPAALEKSARFLRTQWDAGKGAFRYISGPCPAAAGDPNGLAGDLNGLLVNTMAFMYAATGDPSWRELTDDVFAGMLAHGYPSGTKQFNQEFTASYRALGYRQGAATTPARRER